MEILPSQDTSAVVTGNVVTTEQKPPIAAGQPAETSGVVLGALVSLAISYGVIKGNDAGAWAIVIGALPMIVTNAINWLTRRAAR